MARSHRLSTLLLAVLATTSLLVPLLALESASAQAPPTGADERALVASLRDRSDGPVTLDRDPVTGAVTFVGTSAGAPITSPDGTGAAAADGFVVEFAPLFGATDPGDLERTSAAPRVDGGTTVRYQQTTDGVPVLAGELAVQVDEHGDVLSALGELAPRLAVDTEPTVAADAARAAAVEATAKAYDIDAATLIATAPERWVYAPDLLGAPSAGLVRLTWRLEVAGPGTDTPIRELVLVDARTGGIALQFNQVASGLDRGVCDFGNSINPVDTCVPPFSRAEGDPPMGQTDVDDAYDYSGDVYGFYSDHFGRDSLDGAGMSLLSTVRYCFHSDYCPYANAYWNGTQMVYGEGYASADDVVGHELTHGVTDFESHLFYYFQSGALSESLSDIFGEYIDLTNGAGNDAPGVRWLAGEDLPIGAIRSMSNPPAFGDPDKMTSPNYTLGLDDQGGVHTNSGVGNKAAFLMTDGGSFDGHTVSGIGIDKAARVIYEAATTLLVSGSDYADLNRALFQGCSNLVGVGGITTADCTQVKAAANAVEMGVVPPNAPAPEAPEACAAGQVYTSIFNDDLENTGSGNWATTAEGSNWWAYPQNPNPYTADYDFDATYATSGTTNFFGADWDSTSTIRIAMTHNVRLSDDSVLRFDHAYELENTYDGGRVEYSTNAGASWHDAGSLFTHNGYNGSIHAGAATVPAFTGLSNGYRSSRLDLSSLPNANVRFRFVVQTDASVAWFGWFVDDIQIFSCHTPRARPDAHVRIGATGVWAGDNVYNTTGDRQTRSVNVGARGTGTFYARIQNDGEVTEPMRVKGTAGTTRFNATYFAGTEDVTAAVVNGTYETAPIAPGANVKLKVVIKARAGTPVGASFTASVKATSTVNTTKKDVVKATVTRTR